MSKAGEWVGLYLPCMTVTLPILEPEDDAGVLIGMTSVPRWTTWGCCAVNGRWRVAKEVNGVEIAVVELSLQVLKALLLRSDQAALPTTKITHANKA